MHEPALPSGLPPGIPSDPVVRSPTVRSAELELEAWNGTLVFRVEEPPPFRALRVVGHLGKLLGPVLVQVLSGVVRLPKPAKCEACGKSEAEQIPGDRWRCTAKDAHGEQCGNVWPIEWHLDAKGQPMVLTWGIAMSSPSWRRKVVEAIEDRLASVKASGDMLEELVCELLVGCCSVRYPSVQRWIPIKDKDQLEQNAAQCVNSAAALMMLAIKAMETWALPMLGDVTAGRQRSARGTSPATKATETAGGSSPTPQDPAPGRVPPRTAPRASKRSTSSTR